MEMFKSFLILSSVYTDIKNGNLINYTFQYYFVIMLYLISYFFTMFGFSFLILYFLFGALPLLDYYL